MAPHFVLQTVRIPGPSILRHDLSVCLLLLLVIAYLDFALLSLLPAWFSLVTFLSCVLRPRRHPQACSRHRASTPSWKHATAHAAHKARTHLAVSIPPLRFFCIIVPLVASCSSQVAVGSLVLVRPGDRVPIDGDVVAGCSAADESMLTGVAVPVTG